jgi:hypothetical protein
MSKITMNPFEVRQVGSDLVEVWNGAPGAAESEFVCCVNIQLVPQLIATLRKVSSKI